jgi:hypothetical protein
MANLWRDFWTRKTGTGQQVAQLHDRYMMMMTNLFQMEEVNVRSYFSFTKEWSWCMGCDALCPGRHLSNFRTFFLSALSGYKTRSSGFSYAESEEIVFLWWNGKFPPHYKAPHDWLWAGRYGDRIPVGARFFAHIKTGPGAHPACCTMGTGSSQGVKRPGRGSDHPSSI